MDDTAPDALWISAKEVRHVLDHAMDFSAVEWGEFMEVHPETIKNWRARGLPLGRWGNPSAAKWDRLREAALANLRKIVSDLEGD